MISPWKKTSKQPRRSYTRDRFASTAEITQQIEDNVSIQQVHEAIEIFTARIPHRCTKEYFRNRNINNYHHKERDIDIALEVERSILSRRYANIEDFESELQRIHDVLVKLMKADQDRANHFKVLLICTLILLTTTAFLGWDEFGLATLFVGGVGALARKLNNKIEASHIKKIVYNPVIDTAFAGESE